MENALFSVMLFEFLYGCSFAMSSKKSKFLRMEVGQSPLDLNFADTDIWQQQ